MRIRVIGTQAEIDLAAEMLCVVGTVASVATYPVEDSPGQFTRYVSVQLMPETLEDLGVVRP